MSVYKIMWSDCFVTLTSDDKIVPQRLLKINITDCSDVDWGGCFKDP